MFKAMVSLLHNISEVDCVHGLGTQAASLSHKSIDFRDELEISEYVNE